MSAKEMFEKLGFIVNYNIKKDDLKKLLLEINDVDTYLEEFGEVEEG